MSNAEIEKELIKKLNASNHSSASFIYEGDEWIGYKKDKGIEVAPGRKGLGNNKPIIAIDMDGVLCDFAKRYRERQLENPNIYYPQSEYGFFENLDPIPGAIKAYWALKKEFNVKILTSPSIHNPLCYTEKRNWVEEYLGFSEVFHLTITKDKHLFKADYLIDDTEYKEFQGTQLLFGSQECPNWNFVLNFFEVHHGCTY